MSVSVYYHLIIYWCVLIAILMIVFWLFYSSVFFLLFCSLPCDLIIVFTVMFVLLSFKYVYQLEISAPYLSFVGVYLGCGFEYTVSLPLFPFLLRFLLDIFRSGKSLLIIFITFSLVVAVQMAVMQVSSSSFYSVILASMGYSHWCI